MKKNEKFIKLYDSILYDDRLDSDEKILLSMYINKSILNDGSVIASDQKDMATLGITDKTIKKKREHLVELGYIKCSTKQGFPSKIEIINKKD